MWNCYGDAITCDRFLFCNLRIELARQCANKPGTQSESGLRGIGAASQIGNADGKLVRAAVDRHVHGSAAANRP